MGTGAAGLESPDIDESGYSFPSGLGSITDWNFNQAVDIPPVATRIPQPFARVAELVDAQVSEACPH
jgi:hypothetical protein